MANASVTFCGGVGSVTGANFLFEAGGKKILIDCGLIQGSREAESLNRKAFPYDPAGIDMLLVTHAHMDHIGRIPKLVREGFKGEIWSTAVTREIAALMFEDALSVMAHEEKQEGFLPLYEKKDTERTRSLWHDISYHEKKEIDGLSIVFKDAGHILGSAMIEITFKAGEQSRNIVFTGDLGNSPSLLLPDTEKITDADYLVMESVYGDRNHEDKEEREIIFKNIIEETIARGGTLVIPAFSLERTQMILYLLNNLIEEKKIPEVPVFLDSPLAIKVTQVYQQVEKYFKDEVKAQIKKGDDIFDFPGLQHTLRRAESAAIKNVTGPKIVMAGSGMSEGGRVIYHEAEYLGEPENTILFVGYQGGGTLGRKLIEGVKKLAIHGKEIRVRAHIEQILGFSSHKDRDHLIEFVEDSKETLKKVFVVMGEQRASTFLAQRLRDYIDVPAFVPERGETIVLT